MRHLGFHAGACPHRRFAWFIEFWENLYFWWLIQTYSPTSLRHRRFSGMGRTEVGMLGADFLKRYGGSTEPSQGKASPGMAARGEETGAQRVPLP